MLERRFIREQTQSVRQALQARRNSFDLDAFLDLDNRERDLRSRAETLKAQRNQISERIGQKKSQGEEAQAELQQAKELGEQIKASDQELEGLQKAIQGELLRIPNIPNASVPVGADASANTEVRQWGQPPELSFSPKTHWELGEALGMLDFERAAKIAGARFVVYKNAGARLERALIQFMLDTNIREGKYTEIIPPLLVNQNAMQGTGQLPNLEADMFKLHDDPLYLIPTAEVPVTNLHREETLHFAQLPIKYVAYTPCFRREAGSYGKDTKGIVRQHQFNKVELVKITDPASSYSELEALVKDAEKLLQYLELHYRVILLSTGDLSFAAAKCYDLEVWHAGSRRYWEVSSCSNFEDFQARRANIRYKDQQGKSHFCHTLNGSALATSRLLPAIMENCQQPDGSIQIPEVLIPYVNGKKRINSQGELE